MARAWSFFSHFQKRISLNIKTKKSWFLVNWSTFSYISYNKCQNGTGLQHDRNRGHQSVHILTGKQNFGQVWTPASNMKHSIALIFSMAAPYLLDINFANLKRKHCFEKKVILLQSMHQWQNFKKHAILWWKNDPVRHCFQKNFFWEWKDKKFDMLF